MAPRRKGNARAQADMAEMLQSWTAENQDHDARLAPGDEEVVGVSETIQRMQDERQEWQELQMENQEIEDEAEDVADAAPEGEDDDAADDEVDNDEVDDDEVDDDLQEESSDAGESTDAEAAATEQRRRRRHIMAGRHAALEARMNGPRRTVSPTDPGRLERYTYPNERHSQRTERIGHMPRWVPNIILQQEAAERDAARTPTARELRSRRRLAGLGAPRGVAPEASTQNRRVTRSRVGPSTAAEQAEEDDEQPPSKRRRQTRAHPETADDEEEEQFSESPRPRGRRRPAQAATSSSSRRSWIVRLPVQPHSLHAIISQPPRPAASAQTTQPSAAGPAPPPAPAPAPAPAPIPAPAAAPAPPTATAAAAAVAATAVLARGNHGHGSQHDWTWQEEVQMFSYQIPITAATLVTHNNWLVQNTTDGVRRTLAGLRQHRAYVLRQAGTLARIQTEQASWKEIMRRDQG